MDSIEFGETCAYEPGDVMNRVSGVNLMHITRDIRHQNIKVDLKVFDVKGETAFTNMISYVLSPSFIKRLVRKGKTRIDRSIVAITSDNIRVRIKPMMLCNGYLKGGLLAKLAHGCDNFVVKRINSSTFENLFLDAINGKLQKEIGISLKKLYPVRGCEIKSIKMETVKTKIKRGKKKSTETSETKAEEEKVEEPEEEFGEEKTEEVKEETEQEAEEEPEEEKEEEFEEDTFEGQNK